MFCRKCGKEIPDDSEFCYKCGVSVVMEVSNSQTNRETKESLEGTTKLSFKKLPSPIIQNGEKVCPNCGNKVTAPWCTHCGIDLLVEASNINSTETQVPEKKEGDLASFKNEIQETIKSPEAIHRRVWASKIKSEIAYVVIFVVCSVIVFLISAGFANARRSGHKSISEIANLARFSNLFFVVGIILTIVGIVHIIKMIVAVLKYEKKRVKDADEENRVKDANTPAVLDTLVDVFKIICIAALILGLFFEFIIAGNISTGSVDGKNNHNMIMIFSYLFYAIFFCGIVVMIISTIIICSRRGKMNSVGVFVGIGFLITLILVMIIPNYLFGLFVLYGIIVVFYVGHKISNYM